MNFKKVVSLTIPGKPMGKQRPRSTRRGISYTPKETINYESYVRELYVSKVDQYFGDAPLHMSIVAYLKIPKSTSKRRTVLMQGKRILPVKTPDLDNIAKIIMDALHTVAYANDKCVVSLECRKFYGEQERVEITISEIETEE